MTCSTVMHHQYEVIGAEQAVLGCATAQCDGTGGIASGLNFICALDVLIEYPNKQGNKVDLGSTTFY